MRRTMRTHSLTFYRPGTKTLIDGEIVNPAPTSLGAIWGSLQPLVQGARFGEIVKVLPSGLESVSIKLFYSETMTLRYSNTLNKEYNDYTTLSDGVYEVFMKAPWDMEGFTTKHTLYVLVRRPDSTGDMGR